MKRQNFEDSRDKQVFIWSATWHDVLNKEHQGQSFFLNRWSGAEYYIIGKNSEAISDYHQLLQLRGMRRPMFNQPSAEGRPTHRPIRQPTDLLNYT